MKIFFVYSSADSVSLEVMKRISNIQELKSVTTPIDASHPEINSVLKASKKIVVNEIPVIINYGSPDGSIQKYEGLKSVMDFVDEVEQNIAQHEAEAAAVESTVTNLSDLGLYEEPELMQAEEFKPTVIQQPAQITPQNMPIKAKRGAAQSRKIEDFKAGRDRPMMNSTSDNSDPARIKITSPPMTR
jgi:hypothetical protein